MAGQSTPQALDFSKLFDNRAAGAPLTATAGGAGDATATLGTIIDRQSATLGPVMSLAALLSFVVQAVLQEGETVTALLELVHGDAANLSDAAVLETPIADIAAADKPFKKTVVLTGGSGGSTELSLVDLMVNLEGAKQYIAPRLTLTHSAANTDTSIGAGTVLLGGQQDVNKV